MIALFAILLKLMEGWFPIQLHSSGMQVKFPEYIPQKIHQLMQGAYTVCFILFWFLLAALTFSYLTDPAASCGERLPWVPHLWEVSLAGSGRAWLTNTSLQGGVQVTASPPQPDLSADREAELLNPCFLHNRQGLALKVWAIFKACAHFISQQGISHAHLGSFFWSGIALYNAGGKSCGAQSGLILG